VQKGATKLLRMSTYTAEQMQRRQDSPWTLVQIIGAPIQLLFFFVSGGFVIYTLLTAQSAELTNLLVVIKVAIMYFMCITGMLWEKDVFGHYYFAPEFFWEDAVTTVVMITHTLFIVGLVLNANENTLLTLIVVAYLSYLFNAAQYFWKFLVNRRKRQAMRLQTASAAIGENKNE
jgi:3-vinyl bacteriochlorophyllide hydratase